MKMSEIGGDKNGKNNDSKSKKRILWNLEYS